MAEITAKDINDYGEYLKSQGHNPKDIEDYQSYLRQQHGVSDTVSTLKSLRDKTPDAVNKVMGLMSGTFKDTGRVADSPGEYLDSVVGAPVRKSLDEAAQGKGLISSVKSGAGSMFKDPKNAPTGYDVANHMGVENPYGGAALATLIDVGAQLPLVEGISAGSKAISAGSKWAGNALKNIAETRSFKGLGPSKRFEDAAREKGLIQQIGRQALDEGVMTPLASKKTMLKRVEANQAQKENRLSGLLKDVSERKGLLPEQAAALDLEGSRFNPQIAAEELKSNFLKNNDQLPEAVTAPRLEQYDQWLGNRGPMNADEAQRFKLQMQQFIKDPSYWKSNPNASQQGLLDIRNAIKGGIEQDANAYANAVGERGGQIKEVNRALGNDYEMEKILNDKISREGVNRSISPSDYFSAIMGEHALGPVGMLAAPVHKFAREKGSQLMATGANSISKMLLELPTMRTLAEKDPNAFTDVVSKLARQAYIERPTPKAADNENKKGILTAQ